LLRFLASLCKLRRSRQLLREISGMEREIEIRIDMKGHCIETEAKRTYEHLMGRYFDKSISGRYRSILEEQTDGIVFFLRHADFQNLRSQYSELNGARMIRLILKIPENKHEMTIEYDRMKIAPFCETRSSL
jgi:hypothetical protein